MRLSELKTGESATIVKVTGHGGFRRRIMEMGFVRGQRVEVILNAPLKDPIEYKIMGYDISLRRSEADMVVVLSDAEAGEYLAAQRGRGEASGCVRKCGEGTTPCDCSGRGGKPCATVDEVVARSSRTISVALVGNPNSRQDVAVQRRLGRPRARGQLWRRDRRRQDRLPQLPRLPFRGDGPARNLCPDGLHARGTVCPQPYRREDARRGDQHGRGVESGTQPLPDHRTDRHQSADGRGAQHVRRAGAERSEARLRQPGPHAGRADGSGRGAQQPRHRGAARHGDRRFREPRRPRAPHPHQHGPGDRGGTAAAQRRHERPPRGAAQGLPAPLLRHETARGRPTGGGDAARLRPLRRMDRNPRPRDAPHRRGAGRGHRNGASPTRNTASSRVRCARPTYPGSASRRRPRRSSTPS